MLYIFDKDGTLVGGGPGNRPPNKPSEQHPLPGVVEKLAALRKSGHKIAIATNQGGVAWGYISLSTAYRLAHDAADKVGGVDAVAVCPYDERAHGPKARPRYARPSRRRKPAPGMLLDLMRRLGSRPEETVYVGDDDVDRQAAEAAGVRFIWARDFFAPIPRFRYTFSGGMCWECPDHRAATAAEGEPADWEVICISFLRKDLEERGLELLGFLGRLAEALGIARLDYKPRKNPLSTEFGRQLLRQTLGEEEARVVELTHSDEDWAWPGAVRWMAVEDNSVEDGCTTEGCPGYGGTDTPHQDVIIHAESTVCDAFLGALYDWNHGMSAEEAVTWAVISATRIRAYPKTPAARKVIQAQAK